MRSCKSYLAALCGLVLVAICSTGVHADIILSGTGNLTVDNTFLSNQNFMVVFVADQPAVDQLGGDFFEMTQGLFNGTATLTVEDPVSMMTVVAGVEAGTLNALRQDGRPNQEGIFFVNGGNPFAQFFSVSADFSGTEVFDDPNVFGPFPTTLPAAEFSNGGGFTLVDGRGVQFNSVDNSTLTVTGAAVPEPAATTILIVGMSLLSVRRRK